MGPPGTNLAANPSMSRLSLAAVLALLVVLAASADADICSSSQCLVVTASANLKTSPPVSPVVEPTLALLHAAGLVFEENGRWITLATAVEPIKVA